MNANKFAILFTILTLSLKAQLGFAIDPTLKWKTLETEHFKIHFAIDTKAEALRTAKLAEQHHTRLTNLIGWQPKQKTHLVLTDHTDLANGYASPLPFNRSVLFLQPPKAGRLEFSDWLYSLLLHEYVHVLHLDKSKDIPNKVRNILGRFWLLFPNTFQPSWMIEGFATYHESVEGEGRGNSSMFELMMRAEVSAGLKPLSEIHMGSPSWPLNARYLYGYYFFEFIERQYGREYVRRWIDAYSNNWVPYALNTTTQEVFQKDLDVLWQEFKIYLESKWPGNRQLNESLREPITRSGFFKYASEWDDLDQFWYVENNGYSRTSLKVYNEQSTQTRVILNGPSKLDYQKTKGLLIAQPEMCGEFNTYYDLYHYIPEQDRLERLTHCARYQEAQWINNNQIVALSYRHGKARLDLLTSNGQFVSTLMSFNEEVVSDLDVSPDGHQLVVSIQSRNRPNAQLAHLDIRKNQWHFLTEEGVHAWDARFITDSKVVYASDRLKGRFNLYSVNLKTSQHQQLSNAEYGLFIPSYRNKTDSIVAAEYSSRGFDFVNVNQQNVKTLDIPQKKASFDAEAIDEISDFYNITDYSALESVAPKFWFPFAVGNENTQEVGFQTAGMDALEQHNYLAGLSIELERNLANAFLRYQYDYRFDFKLENYYDIIDDDNSATADFVEQSSEVQFIYRFADTALLDRWTLEVGLMQDNLRQYVGFEDDLNFVREVNDSAMGLVLSYDSSAIFARSISRSDGRQVKWSLVDNNVLDSSFTGKRSVVDWREFIPLVGEQVLTFRGLAASAEYGSPNFRLSGDDIDPFSMRSSRLIKDKFLLRGYPDFSPLLTGRHVRMAKVEWHLPLGHVERSIMIPPVGIEEMSLTVFSERARVYGQSPTVEQLYSSENISDRIYQSYGIEINIESRLGYFLPLNVRIGYANIDDRIPNDDNYYVRFGIGF